VILRDQLLCDAGRLIVLSLRVGDHEANPLVQARDAVLPNARQRIGDVAIDQIGRQLCAGEQARAGLGKAARKRQNHADRNRVVVGSLHRHDVERAE
jgi:hypothetical protein